MSRKHATGCALALMSLTLGACSGGHEASTNVGESTSDLFSNASTQFFSSQNVWNIPVCWDESATPGADWTEEKALIKAAVLRTWQRATALTFTGWAACPTSGELAEVRVALKFVYPPNGPWGQTTAPEGIGELHTAAQGPSTSLGLLVDHSTSTTTLQYDAVHEFGHILGFEHEMDQVGNVAGKPGYCAHSYTTPSTQLWTAYDPWSVMNYCAPMLPKLSDLDRTGVQEVYGLGPRAHVGFVVNPPTDLVWTNTQNQQLGLWQMKRSSVSIEGYQYPGTFSPSMQPLGTGDFNGDGNVDVVFLDSSNQHYVLWLLRGGTVLKTVDLGTVATGISAFEGIGDFNGDGESDLLFRFQDGTVGAALVVDQSVWIVPKLRTDPVTPDWQIVGIGDFNNRQRSEILWRNTQTNVVGIWELTGTGIAAGGATWNPPLDFSISVESYDYPNGNNAVDPAWHVKGVGDFDGDGMSDILWANTSTNQVAIRLMAGSKAVKSYTPPFVRTMPIIGVADIDDDGRSDILYRDPATNFVYVDVMAGGSVAYTAKAQNTPVPTQWVPTGSGTDVTY